MEARGYQAYKQQSVNTMTQGELLILLYDEMIKRLGRAEVALKQNQDELFFQSVTRSKEIVLYLIETLNFQYPISHELKRMYDYFLYELSRMEAGKKGEAIPDLQRLVKELRDAFSGASRSTNI